MRVKPALLNPDRFSRFYYWFLRSFSAIVQADRSERECPISETLRFVLRRHFFHSNQITGLLISARTDQCQVWSGLISGWGGVSRWKIQWPLLNCRFLRPPPKVPCVEFLAGIWWAILMWCCFVFLYCVLLDRTGSWGRAIRSEGGKTNTQFVRRLAKLQGVP